MKVFIIRLKHLQDQKEGVDGDASIVEYGFSILYQMGEERKKIIVTSFKSLK